MSLGCHLYGDNRLITFDYYWQALSQLPVAPGEKIEATFEWPALSAGDYVLEFDCVARQICWFAEFGSEPVSNRLHVSEPFRPAGVR